MASDVDKYRNMSHDELMAEADGLSAGAELCNEEVKLEILGIWSRLSLNGHVDDLTRYFSEVGPTMSLSNLRDAWGLRVDGLKNGATHALTSAQRAHRSSDYGDVELWLDVYSILREKLELPKHSSKSIDLKVESLSSSAQWHANRGDEIGASDPHTAGMHYAMARSLLGLESWATNLGEFC